MRGHHFGHTFHEVGILMALTLFDNYGVDGDAAGGSSICNRVNVSATGGLDVRTSDPACVLIGSPLGTGGRLGSTARLNCITSSMRPHAVQAVDNLLPSGPGGWTFRSEN